MRILILGGDGYLGWPTAMYFSAQGHEVFVADNYMRRDLARNIDADPLFAVPNLDQRAMLWKESSGRDITVWVGDLADWKFHQRVVRDSAPEVVIHYAEQPSAPFSMRDRSSAQLTLLNNLGVTFNLIYAIRESAPDAHVVKLGTMGEYGTPNIDIEEGWLDITHKGREDRFLYPRQAGSLYHTTKIMDTDMLWFYARMWGLRVTDLMQGPVYGVLTDEMNGREEFFTHFNYDEVFGTVLNRFMVQAVMGLPLTVYGRGGQTRGYLNIKDTLQCVGLAANSTPGPGEMRIYNQFTETFTVNELAERVQQAGTHLGLDVKVAHVENPRVEKEEHYYNPAHSGLSELGLEPNLLTVDVLAEAMSLIQANRDRVRLDRIQPSTKWG